MAQINRMKSGVIRLKCDCGEYIHELFKEEDGSITCETMELEKKKNPEPPPAPPAPVQKPRSKSIFED